MAYESVKSLYNHHKDRETRPTLEKFLDVLKSVTRSFTKVFVVVDALDECCELTRAELFLALRSLASTANLLVTSRDITSIEQYFRDNRRLNIHAMDQDVGRYIKGRIPRLERLKIHVDTDPALQEEVIKAITGNVKGM